MTFFQRMASAIQGPRIETQQAINTPIRHNKPLNGADMTHYKELVPLRKGQRVTLKSGKTVVVEGASDNFFWAGKESLPYFRGDVIS